MEVNNTKEVQENMSDIQKEIKKKKIRYTYKKSKDRENWKLRGREKEKWLKRERELK